MKKTTYLMIVMAVLVILFVSACGGAAAPQESVDQAPAPACQSASCSAPDVKDTVASDRYCVDKNPYQNILIDDGVTFEVLDPANLTCADNGTIVDGKHVVECHGTPAWKTQLKFTNTACSGADCSTTITVNMGACSE
jgi:hypothetical protein